MASGTSVVIPSNGVNIIQTASGLSSIPLQTSGATPYPQYGAQQLGISTSDPQQVPQKSPSERFFKAEPKVLGAVQILIGLNHIGFGAIWISSIVSRPSIPSSCASGGYPFWGGIFFISSGSLCVAAANRPNRGLVKAIIGMNITSAIMSLIGIFLNISDLIMNDVSQRYIHQHATNHLSNIGFGYSSVLLFFSVLEFCIAVSLAHFGCQSTCCIDDQSTVLFVPYVIGGGAVAAEPNLPIPPPPTHDNMDTKSQ